MENKVAKIPPLQEKTAVLDCNITNTTWYIQA